MLRLWSVAESVSRTPVDMTTGALASLHAMLHNVEASHRFHNLLLYRDWEFVCILEEFAPIKPLQVQLIGMYVAALLSALH